jgi:site-specific DNA recombinase
MPDFFSGDVMAIYKIAVYCRVSSEDQQERGTIGAQIEFAEQYANLHKLQISNWYNDDGVSGTIPLEEREHGARLIEDARNKKFNLLLVYRLDRLGRTTRVILNAVHELEQCGAVVRSMTEPFDTGNSSGVFLLTILAAVAALERETTLERLWHGTNRAARSGKWLGGIVPYGYRVTQDRFLEISEEPLPGSELSEAGVIRLIYKLICEHGLTTIRIADYLNALNIPPSYTKDNRMITKGKRKVNTSGNWLPGRISNMLRNPTYKGAHYYGKRTKKQRELISREMPAIVSEDVWDQACRILTENRANCFNPTGHKYLLRGLIKCGVCGLHYHGAHFKERGYYRCNGKMAYQGPMQGKCTSKYLSKERVEELVWNDCLQFISNPENLINELANTSCEKKSRKEELETEIKALSGYIVQKEVEKQKILDLYRMNIIDNSDVEKQLAKISREKNTLLQRVSALGKEIDTDRASVIAISSIERLMADLHNKIKEGEVTFEIKREIVQLLVDRVLVESKPDENNRIEAKLHIYYSFVKDVPCTDRGSSMKQK